MYFDPVSSWLVALLADGIVVAGQNNGKLDEHKRQILTTANEALDKDIRALKYRYGTRNPESTLEEISERVTSARNWIMLNKCNGTLFVSLDNRDYIIKLLEECEKKYRCIGGGAAKQKAEWYKRKVAEARKSKEKEKQRLVDEANERQRENARTIIWGVIAVLVFIFVLLLK